MKLMPINPLPIPLIDRFRRFTVAPTPLMLKPFVPAARTEPKVPPQSIVIDFVIVTAPKPPGSRQSISPLGAVFEIAPANVLQGAVRLQGLASSPTPETHVRVAWARAGTACSARTTNIAAKVTDSEILCMTPSERAHRRRRRRSAQRHGRIGYGIVDGTLFARARRHARQSHRFPPAGAYKSKRTIHLKSVSLNTPIRNLSNQASGCIAVSASASQLQAEMPPTPDRDWQT